MTGAGSRIDALTNDGLLRRNVLLNLAGWALPAVAALVAIPVLTRALGPERFGLLALAWAAVGIFSLFDFGMGRALTRMVAGRLARHADSEIGDVVWSASWVLLGLTSLLAVTGLVAAPAIVDRGLSVPESLRAEAVGVIRLLAVCIPPLAHGVALRGVLEAGQRFGRVNQLRIPLGIASYAGPLLAIPFGADARVAVGVVVVARTGYWLAHFPVLGDVATGIARPRWPRGATFRELARVGGWITVSNVISPIIVNADRVVVAMLFPIAITGWYGAAAEVASKQLLFTAALGPVLFAALAAAILTHPQRAAELTGRAVRVIVLALLPVALGLMAVAEPGLRLWLGPAYVPEAATVLRLLTAAIYVNALGQVAYFLLQSGVDARAAALVHLGELPVHVGATVLAAHRWGPEGVALVWLARMVIDTLIMWAVVYVRMPDVRRFVHRDLALTVACWVAVAVAGAWSAWRFG